MCCTCKYSKTTNRKINKGLFKYSYRRYISYRNCRVNNILNQREYNHIAAHSET